MTVQEGQKVIEELKAQGNSDEEIAGSFYLLFRDGKIDVEGLEGLVNLLGFHLTDEFKAMDPEQQKEEGYEILDEEDDEEDYNESNESDESDESEEAQQSEEDEEKEAMSLFDRKDGSANAPKEEEDSNEDEEKKAMKLFGK